MTRHQIIQAWRDSDAYDALEARQRARLSSPVGLPTVSDDDLLVASGGAGSIPPLYSRGVLSIGRYCTKRVCCERPRPVRRRDDGS